MLTRARYFMFGGYVAVTLAMLTAAHAASAHDAPPVAARETITINQGDTVTPRFSMKTDTVLALVPGSNVVGARCGIGMIYMRLWSKGKALSGDSTAVGVINCGPLGTPGIVMYNDVQNGQLVLRQMTVGENLCIVAVLHDSTGHLQIGKPVTFTSSNPAVATVGSANGCPDTTVDPAVVVKAFPHPIGAVSGFLRRIGI